MEQVQCAARQGGYGSPTNEQIFDKVGEEVLESAVALVELTKGADNYGGGVNSVDRGGGSEQRRFQPNMLNWIQ